MASRLQRTWRSLEHRNGGKPCSWPAQACRLRIRCNPDWLKPAVACGQGVLCSSEVHALSSLCLRGHEDREFTWEFTQKKRTSRRSRRARRASASRPRWRIMYSSRHTRTVRAQRSCVKNRSLMPYSKTAYKRAPLASWDSSAEAVVHMRLAAHAQRLHQLSELQKAPNGAAL